MLFVLIFLVMALIDDFFNAIFIPEEGVREKWRRLKK